MGYKERIENYNKSPKYQSEMNFVIQRMNIKPTDLILDYGCGTGFMAMNIKLIHNIDVYGYDVNPYNKYIQQSHYRNDFDFGLKFDKIYLMHSIAYIPDLMAALKEIKHLYKIGTKLFIFTPNRLYFDEMGNKGVDETIIGHYAPNELDIFLQECGFLVNFRDQFGMIGITNMDNLFIEATYVG